MHHSTCWRLCYLWHIHTFFPLFVHEHLRHVNEQSWPLLSTPAPKLLPRDRVKVIQAFRGPLRQRQGHNSDHVLQDNRRGEARGGTEGQRRWPRSTLHQIPEAEEGITSELSQRCGRALMAAAVLLWWSHEVMAFARWPSHHSQVDSGSSVWFWPWWPQVRSFTLSSESFSSLWREKIRLSV